MNFPLVDESSPGDLLYTLVLTCKLEWRRGVQLFKCSVCSISPFTLAAQHVSFATELSSASMSEPYSTDLHTAIKHAQFVSDAIQELSDTGRIVSCLEPPKVISPLSVSIQFNGKKRLILDLRHVNTFLRKAHVKYEDWKIALSYFERGAYMFSFDLKSGYHHVEIYEGHQTYLAFAWQCPSTGQMKF